MANEKRLIDIVDEAIKRYAKHGNSVQFISDVRFAVINAPTVDAVEVVHGRWEETLIPDGYITKASRLGKKCSVCGWKNACRYRYCPYCGAKMDGGNENA